MSASSSSETNTELMMDENYRLKDDSSHSQSDIQLSGQIIEVSRNQQFSTTTKYFNLKIEILKLLYYIILY